MMLPLGAQADVSIYGRITNGIKYVDPAEPGADSTTDVHSYGSRFGFKANSDLGNGMTAIGHFEFQASTDNTGANADGLGNMKTRLGYVGVEGGFGKVTIGNQGAAFYSNVHFDRSFWNGGHGGYPGSRSSNTIKYSNAVGPLSFQADLRVDAADDGAYEANTEDLGKGNGGALGLQAALSDNLTLGFGFDTQDQADMTDGTETDVFGMSGLATFGQFDVSLAYANKEVSGEEDTQLMQLWASANLTDQTLARVGYGQEDQDESEATPSTLTAVLIHNLGGGFRVWYEGNAADDDVADMDTKVTHEFGLRFDF